MSRAVKYYVYISKKDTLIYIYIYKYIDMTSRMGEYSRVLRGSLVVHAATRNSYAYIIIRSRSMIVIAIDDQNNYTIDDR